MCNGKVALTHLCALEELEQRLALAMLLVIDLAIAQVRFRHDFSASGGANSRIVNFERGRNARDDRADPQVPGRPRLEAVPRAQEPPGPDLDRSRGAARAVQFDARGRVRPLLRAAQGS